MHGNRRVRLRGTAWEHMLADVSSRKTGHFWRVQMVMVQPEVLRPLAPHSAGL